MTIEIIDAEMGKDPGYLTAGKTPLERAHKLLSKLDSIRRSKERGAVVSELEKGLSYKFMGQVESICKNLPKPLDWRSFLMNDLILLTDIPSKIQKTSNLYTLPERGKILPELQDQGIHIYRELIVTPWRIIYRISDTTVFVLSVIDARRNVEDILLDRLIK